MSRVPTGSLGVSVAREWHAQRRSVRTSLRVSRGGSEQALYLTDHEAVALMAVLLADGVPEDAKNREGYAEALAFIEDLAADLAKGAS